jgi:hypothetical protein
MLIAYTRPRFEQVVQPYYLGFHDLLKKLS